MSSSPAPAQGPLAEDLIAPYAGVSFLGGGMPIVEDYDAIAKRLRELKPSANSKAKDTPLDKWRDLAEETARVYVQNRRRGPLADSVYLLHRARSNRPR
jgi:hypothetical protein